MTWQSLATFAGCTAGVAVLTQFVKNLGVLKNVATQWVSYGLALVLLYCATYFTGALTGPMAALIPFNAVVVALAANGAFSALDRVTKYSNGMAADGDVGSSSTADKGEAVMVEQTDVTPAESTTDSKVAEATDGADVKVTTGAAKASETVPETSESASKTVIG